MVETIVEDDTQDFILSVMIIKPYYDYAKLNGKEVFFVLGEEKIVNLKQLKKLTDCSKLDESQFKNRLKLLKECASKISEDEEFSKWYEEQQNICEKCGCPQCDHRKLDQSEEEWKQNTMKFDDGTYGTVYLCKCPGCGDEYHYVTGNEELRK